MKISSRSRAASVRIVAVLIACLLAAGTCLAGGWTQWGGPAQSFHADSKGLSGSWPESGPKSLWSRELGDGYSAILVEGNRLYTMYRNGDKEAVVCLDAKSGETLWEYAYDSSPRQGHVHQFGDGPRATPLLVGNQLFTIGVAGMMHALDKNSGKLLWSHDLWGEEFGGSFLNHGYSSSPIEYKNTVIALVGGEGAGIVAFNKKDGKVAWKAQSFANSYSTPRILKINGEEQLVTFMAKELIGVDPSNGALKWRHPHENQWGQNISMPVLIGENILFLSSPQAGARGIKIVPDGDKQKVEEVWSTRKIQFYHVTTVRDGDYVYGSTGTMGPAFMSAVNARTGEIAWRERGIAKANCIAADGKLFILDEEGKLYMTKASPDGFSIEAQHQLFDGTAWTVPTIVGKTMFVRDKKTIVALDLG